MASPGFKKGVAIYFLVIALPGVATALWGEYMFWDFLHTPQYHDFPDDPDALNYERLWASFYGLAVLLILGLALIPGYCLQVFKPSALWRYFWHSSTACNALLLLAYAAFLWPMNGPPDIDWSIFAFFALVFGLPLLGLGLSATCLRSAPIRAIL